MKRVNRKLAGVGGSLALLLTGFMSMALPAYAAPTVPTTVALVGDLQNEVGCSDDWTPNCVESQLTPVEGQEGVFESTFTIPEGTWEYKVAFNGTWDESYPADNRTLTIAGPTDIRFTYLSPTDDRVERLALTPVLTGPHSDADNALVQTPVQQSGAGQNFYFVLADRFNNGDTSNDWGGAATAAEGGFDPTNKGFYFGGDIAGLTDKLDYIDGLGTSAIWLAPMFKNQAVQGEGADKSAGYHGYWVTDFTQIDPHYGTNDEMKAFIDAAHAKGMKVYFDIITNHTADIISYEEGEYAYKYIADWPYYDAAGNVIDVEQLAATRAPWPELNPLTSFPYTPAVTPGKENVKVPEWLNDVTLYHNRGDSTWEGESVTFGDFQGLDDIMTEHPTVVDGFVDVYNAWVDFGIDGFRIDTVKHVNFEFWEDWTTPVAEHAATIDPEFFTFGEVYSADQSITSEYVRNTDMSSTLDFAFQAAASTYATGASARTLSSLYANDAYFVTPKSSPGALPTFLGNHDMGRIGSMVARVGDSLKRDQLAHQIMYFTRGQPVVYYGDEQGFAGDGDGTDKQARQPLFGDKGGAFGGQATLDGNTIGADPMFNTDSILYKTISELAAVRDAHPALKSGGQIERYVEDGPGIYAFSRVDDTEKTEYLVAVNNATSEQSVTVPSLTSGAAFTALYGTTTNVTSDAEGKVQVTVPALSSVVLVADREVDSPEAAAGVTVTAPHPGAALKQQTQVSADINSNVWQQTSFSWRVVGGDTWTPLGATDAASPSVYHDLNGLSQGTLIEYRAVTTDASGQHAAASTYGSVGNAVGLEDDPGADFEIYMVNIPGSHQLAMGCSGVWMPACEESKLTPIANGLYKGTFDVPEGDYEYKVALNGAWDVNYGVGGVLDGDNAKYTAPGGDLDFYWDPVTRIFTNTALGQVAVIAGDFQSQLGCEGDNGGNWQPWCFGSLAEPDGTGIYEFSTNRVAAGTYQGKAAFDTGWDDTIGNEQGENVSFTLTEDYSTLKFVVDANKDTMCVYENDVELYCPSGGGPVDPIPDASLVVSPTSVEAGKSFDATTTNFEAGEQIKFVISSTPGATNPTSVEIGEGTADEKGALTTRLTVDAKHVPGDYVVQARGTTSDRTAEAALQVTKPGTGPEEPEDTEPSLTVNPNQVRPGQTFVATAKNFKGGEPIVFSIVGHGLNSELARGTADATGTVKVTLTAPSNATLGSYEIKATGGTSHDVATAELKIQELAVTGAQVTGLLVMSVILLLGGTAALIPRMRSRRLDA